MRVFEVGDVEVSVIVDGKKKKAKKGEYIVFDSEGKNPQILSKEAFDRIYKEVNNERVSSVPQATIL